MKQLSTILLMVLFCFLSVVSFGQDQPVLQDPLFENLDQVLYNDASHTYDDEQVIMLSKKRIPIIQSKLMPVKAGDNFIVEVNVHYTKANRQVWQKIGATAAGLAIGSLPYLLDEKRAGEGKTNNGLLKKIASLAGAGIAGLPFVLNKKRLWNSKLVILKSSSAVTACLYLMLTLDIIFMMQKAYCWKVII